MAGWYLTRGFARGGSPIKRKGEKKGDAAFKGGAAKARQWGP